MYFLSFIFIFGSIFEHLGFSEASENITNTTSAARGPENSGDKEFDPTWIIVTTALFSGLLVVSLTISLTVAIYKYRRYHKRHGLYKKKSSVEVEPGSREHSRDYSMFVVHSPSSSQTGLVQASDSDPLQQSTASYMGNTNN